MRDLTKQELRSYLQGKMESVSTGELCAASSCVLQRLRELFVERPVFSTVLIYYPMKAWHELDIASLPDLLPNLHFDFVQNTKSAPFPEKKYDVIIVPLLGFNTGGYRLGHGGGWYDRFLAKQPQALKIGIGREGSCVNFASEPHDIPMDAIVTEKRTRKFPKTPR